MLAHHMANFVAKDRRQFIFTVEEGQNPAGNKNVGVRGRPGINHRLIYDHEGIIASGMGRISQQPFADFSNVVLPFLVWIDHTLF